MAVPIDLLRSEVAPRHPGPDRSLIQRSVTGLWAFVVTGLFAVVGMAWLADWRLETIRSASMEPTVPKGSLAVVARVPVLEIREGDIIAYRDPTDPRRRVMHRVMSVVDRREFGQGAYFATKGDANATPDPFYVGRTHMLGRMRWHIPRLGDVLWFLRPPFGLMLFVAAPALVLLIARWRRRDGESYRRSVCAHCGAVAIRARLC